MAPTPQPARRLARAIAAGAAATPAWRVMLALLVVAVGYLALAPAPPAVIDFGWDKLNHVLAFSALAFSASLSCPASRRMRLLLHFMLFGYGGLIEVLQLFMPGRACECGDLFADSVGIVLGAVMAADVIRTAFGNAPPI